jgi:diguanylate cyclase (GGDEF)-like protein
LAGCPFLARPCHRVERVLGVVISLYFCTWLLRGGFTLAYEGPRLAHELYLPPWLVPWYTLIYAVLPIVVASLLLNTVGARLHQQLKSRASTDELTGVLMRRALREMAPAAIARAHAAGREAALVMMDLDHFKAINDEQGHVVGDEVLHHTAQVLQAQLRPDALLGRFGGEEFMLLVEVADITGARAVAERLRLAMASSPWRPKGGKQVDITISVGVALVGHGEGLDTALMRADEALYRAKRGGRDRVEVGLAAAR